MGGKEKKLLIIIGVIFGFYVIAKGWGIPAAIIGYIIYKVYSRWKRGNGTFL